MADFRKLLGPTIESMGYELVGTELAGVGAGTVLRIYIDAPDGIMLEDCERVSRQVSALLDVEDPISSSYTLEVSSPGLDRLLMKFEDFQRFTGEQVKVKMRQAVLGRRNFTGRLLGTEDKLVLLEMDQEVYDLPYADIERARLVPKL